MVSATRRARGYSLMELMISVAIMGFIVLYLMRSFSTQHRTYVMVDEVTEALVVCVGHASKGCWRRDGPALWRFEEGRDGLPPRSTTAGLTDARRRQSPKASPPMIGTRPPTAREGDPCQVE